ncbi:hypothetical protein GF324_00695 [bacterium]|nr:hypothetical protein [bacterium]
MKYFHIVYIVVGFVIFINGCDRQVNNNDEGNEDNMEGTYRVFVPSHDVEGDWIFIGEDNATTSFTLPDTFRILKIESPNGQTTRLDAVEVGNENGETLSYLMYYANGVPWSGFSNSTSNLENRYFCFGKEDNLPAMLGMAEGDAGEIAYMADQYPVAFSTVTIHITDNTVNDRPYYNRGGSYITDYDKNEISTIVENIILGYETKNKQIILPYYQAQDTSKIGEEIDLIFEHLSEFDMEITEHLIRGSGSYASYGIKHIHGSCRFNDDYSNSINGQSVGHNDDIIFRKVDDAWKIQYDFNGPHMTILKELAREGYYHFW